MTIYAYIAGDHEKVSVKEFRDLNAAFLGLTNLFTVLPDGEIRRASAVVLITQMPINEVEIDTLLYFSDNQRVRLNGH